MGPPASNSPSRFTRPTGKQQRISREISRSPANIVSKTSSDSAIYEIPIRNSLCNRTGKQIDRNREAIQQQQGINSRQQGNGRETDPRTARAAALM
jgi:hypothetical protein